MAEPNQLEPSPVLCVILTQMCVRRVTHTSAKSTVSPIIGPILVMAAVPLATMGHHNRIQLQQVLDVDVFQGEKLCVCVCEECVNTIGNAREGERVRRRQEKEYLMERKNSVCENVSTQLHMCPS